MRWSVALIGICAVMGCSAMHRQVAERRAACDSYCKRARAARSEGYPDQADLLLNEAVRQRPDDLETRRDLAESLWECGRQQDAIAEYRELSQTHPRDPRLHQRLAVMYWTAGERDQASQSADRTLQLDRNSTEALLVKARTAAARGESDAALAAYIRLAHAAPDLIEAKLELAELHVQRGNAQQACTILRDVVAQSRLTTVQRADTEWKLGLTYASADRWSEAATHLGNAIAQRTSSIADRQLLLTAQTLAGQETSSIPATAVTASADLPAETAGSTWSALRDRLAVRGEILVNASHSDRSNVIRADFSKSVQALAPQ